MARTATSVPMVHPALGDDEVYEAVNEDHAAALGAIGWVRQDAPAKRETVDAVLERVGNDPALAAEALAVEQAGDPRKTLVTKLEAIANPGQEA